MAKLKDGFYKQTAEDIGSDLYVLLAGGGSKALSDFAYKSDLTGSVTGGPYLPLAGGTMTGSTTVNSSVFPAFVLNNTNSSGFESGIRFEIRGSNKGYVGYHNSYGTYIWNSTAQRYICISDDGTGYLRSVSTAYELLHSGNYNSYSPKLDGTGASGTWGINITGNASTATDATYTSYIKCPDTRSVAYDIRKLQATLTGVSFDFKSKAVSGLSADFSGIMTYRPYETGTDWSGGPAHLLAFDLDGLHYRQYGGSGFTTWKTLAYTTDIPTVTNYYWADQQITSSAVYTASPTLSSLRVQGSGGGRGTIYLVSASDVPNDLYFGAGGQLDWSLSSRNSSEGRYFGLYNSSVGWAFQVEKSNNRFKVSEWIQFDNATGLYWPNHPNTGIEMHIRPNTYSSYGGFAMYGKRGSYSGILLGTSNTNLCFMDDGDNSGLYIESLSKWIIYSLRSSNQIGIGTSSCTANYGITLGSSTHLKGNLLINGESYCYTLTTESSSNWVYLTKLLTGSSASGKSYEAGIGWHNTGGGGNGALTLVPHAQNTEPWMGSVGLFITKTELKYNGDSVWHAGNLTKISQLTNDAGYLTSIPSHSHSYIPFEQSVNGKDMDTIKTTGFYYGYTMTNSAYTGISSFIVAKYSDDWGSQIQMGADQKMYIRFWQGVGGVMQEWKTLAFTSDIPSVTDYYWANVPVSATSNAATSPTFASAVATNHINIGYTLGQNIPNRAELSLISPGAYPVDIILGADSTKYWSITARNSTDSNSKGFGIYDWAAGDYRLVINSSGNVGIGTYNPEYKLEVAGSICGTVLHANRGSSTTEGGVSLYSNLDPMTYGIAFRGTGTYGTKGRVQSDWATYLTMSDTTNRGWIFRRGSTNVASVSGEGIAYFEGVGRDTYIAYPGGATYTYGSGNITGALKITLPVKACSTMMHMKITIYNYVDETSSTYHVAGYNYSDGNWYNCTAYSLRQGTNGYGNLTVRFGNDGTKDCIYIGETSTTWSYPNVVVSDVLIGHSSQSHASWSGGWSITVTTSLGNIKATISNPALNYYAQNAGYATTAGYITPLDSLGETGTVKAAKDWIVTLFTNIGSGIGANINVSESIISLWDNESASLYSSSGYAFIKIGGKYSGTTYGLWLLSSHGSTRVGYVGRSSDKWTKIYWLATTDDIPKVTNYYWANVKISDQSSTATSPTFANATTTGLLTVSTGDSHCGIKAGYTYINSINSDLILQNNGAIRFGTDSWDYNCWAGLKYVHYSKTISLGLADGTHFAANTAQSGGTMQFPGINKFLLNGVVHVKSGSPGQFDDGIRLYGSAKESAWSNINFGCDPSAASGTHAKQWMIGRNTSNNFMIGAGSTYANTQFEIDPSGNIDIKGTTTAKGSIYTIQPSTNRRVGIIGTYDPNRAAAIWSMGDAYQISTNGLSFGGLYGAAYAYFGSGYTFGAKYSIGHSFVWCQAGTPSVALGNNIWTKGSLIADCDGYGTVKIYGTSGGNRMIEDLGTTNGFYIKTSASWGMTLKVNTNEVVIGNNTKAMYTNQALDLGTSSKPWGNIYGTLKGDADTVDGYHIQVVSSLPASRTNNTIYIVI